jgi:tRNA (guanine26-N2/guanine27-N2)-dimethyltransferase
MRENRDISVSIFKTLTNKNTILDANTATGIRGLRYKKHMPGRSVTLCDVNEKAIELAKKNAKANILDVEILNRDAVDVMMESNFDIIDIDPYGTPSRFMDAAARSARLALGITATDTATLNGVYPKVSEKRYGIASFRCPFSKEIGTRILLTAIMDACTKHGKVFVPLLSYQSRHYVRVFGSVKKKRKRPQKSLVHACACGYWSKEKDNRNRRSSVEAKKCKVCGKGLKTIGPLYLSPLHDKNVLKKAIEYAEKNGFRSALMKTALQEIDVPFYYDVHKLGKGTLPKMKDIVEKLKENGHRASRTVFSPTGIKTDAGLKELLTYIK